MRCGERRIKRNLRRIARRTASEPRPYSGESKKGTFVLIPKEEKEEREPYNGITEALFRDCHAYRSEDIKGAEARKDWTEISIDEATEQVYYATLALFSAYRTEKSKEEKRRQNRVLERAFSLARENAPAALSVLTEELKKTNTKAVECTEAEGVCLNTMTEKEIIDAFRKEITVNGAIWESLGRFLPKIHVKELWIPYGNGDFLWGNGMTVRGYTDVPTEGAILRLNGENKRVYPLLAGYKNYPLTEAVKEKTIVECKVGSVGTFVPFLKDTDGSECLSVLHIHRGEEYVFNPCGFSRTVYFHTESGWKTAKTDPYSTAKLVPYQKRSERCGGAPHGTPCRVAFRHGKHIRKCGCTARRRFVDGPYSVREEYFFYGVSTCRMRTIEEEGKSYARYDFSVNAIGGEFCFEIDFSAEKEALCDMPFGACKTSEEKIFARRWMIFYGEKTLSAAGQFEYAERFSEKIRFFFPKCNQFSLFLGENLSPFRTEEMACDGMIPCLKTAQEYSFPVRVLSDEVIPCAIERGEEGTVVRFQSYADEARRVRIVSKAPLYCGTVYGKKTVPFSGELTVEGRGQFFLIADFDG